MSALTFAHQIEYNLHHKVAWVRERIMNYDRIQPPEAEVCGMHTHAHSHTHTHRMQPPLQISASVSATTDADGTHDA